MARGGNPPPLPSNLNLDTIDFNSVAEIYELFYAVSELMKYGPFDGIPAEWPIPGDARMDGTLTYEETRYKWNGGTELVEEIKYSMACLRNISP